ncbi:MAG: hypothetical protein IPG14_09325, partial [Dehalococcoidia bacterium]|nr:hypothetical protein [Dehalococcoidia bacterium]
MQPIDRASSPIPNPFVALSLVALAAWTIIWSWFAAVESDWAETDWWTE